MRAALRAVWDAVERRLRGPRASRALEKFGIDPRRYWLLMDLFAALSERGEMMDQLGRAGVALEFVAWLYFGLSALMSVLFVVVHPPLATYFLTFQALSGFLILTVLLSEAGNSLVNPVEALVLAHQPINGATYTAAKLSHLLRIVLYLAPGMSIVPAIAGLTLDGAGWWYPLAHLAAAVGIGLVAALLCCALFGWLIRFLPARRLKAAGQLAGAVPFMGMMWMDSIRRFIRHLHVGRFIPQDPAIRWALAAICIAGALAAVALGIRSLSADYLLRVSSMVRGGAHGGSKVRRSRGGALAARLFGGQPARGGYAFAGRMMLRDWQFRRQLAPMLFPMVFGFGGLLVEGWRKDPFSAGFSTMHLAPHFVGMLLFFVCNILMYSSDYKGAWIFQLAPWHAIDGFAGGVFALLWMNGIAIPHAILAPLVVWKWGAAHGLLFTAYSMAAASVYLALELKLIDGAPFSKQMDPSRGASSMAVMMLGGIGMAIAVGLQYGLLFRWPALAVIATMACTATAVFLGRRSIQTFAIAIRHNLGIESGESGGLYKEVGV